MSLNLYDLTGKIAIVTGTSRGLGKYLARALALAGADLIITSRSLDSLQSFTEEIKSIGRRVLPLALDVGDLQSIDKMTETAYEHYGKIDILVNNAGCNIRKPAVDVSWDDWNLVVNTNLRGSFFLAQAVAKKMIPFQYCRIINIGSVDRKSTRLNSSPLPKSRMPSSA